MRSFDHRGSAPSEAHGRTGPGVGGGRGRLRKPPLLTPPDPPCPPRPPRRHARPRASKRWRWPRAAMGGAAAPSGSAPPWLSQPRSCLLSQPRSSSTRCATTVPCASGCVKEGGGLFAMTFRFLADPPSFLVLLGTGRAALSSQQIPPLFLCTPFPPLTARRLPARPLDPHAPVPGVARGARDVGGPHPPHRCAVPGARLPDGPRGGRCLRGGHTSNSCWRSKEDIFTCKTSDSWCLL